MRNTHYQVEGATPFAESLIWQLNRDYYQKTGVEAWRSDDVPSHMTSNSMVGKTYAELILGFLQDLADKGQTKATVYILELGAGHGRLAFHVLKHLEKLIARTERELPPFCYVLSDIIEDSLTFFQEHEQFQVYLEKGWLDVAYFDALGGDEMHLRHSDRLITKDDLQQPLLALANYFFDTLPPDLFQIYKDNVVACSMALQSSENPAEMNAETLLKNLEPTFAAMSNRAPFYQDDILNEMVEDYRGLLSNTFLYFPQKSLKCLQNLQNLSQKGLLLISMDKGFHEIHDLENTKQPDIVTHGSFSLFVNYHALGSYCKKQGGKAFFSSASTFDLELGCFLFLPESDTYKHTLLAYERHVNDYGPDDFNGLKKFAYRNISRMTLPELIGILRLSSYDSKLFINMLPRIKQLAKEVSFNQRTRLAETMHHTWNMYFSLQEKEDLAFEIGGLLYQLGYFKDALGYFQHSIKSYGHTADGYYNRVLCHYQLRQDALFATLLKEAKEAFPGYEPFLHLDSLDLGAA